MTILVYKDGRWLIDNEQPLEGVSLDNLAAILSNPKDGDVVKYDEESGMWIAGEAVSGSNKFIVTLTPTAIDYSGTMDKTVSEINAAYEAGMEIWFSFTGPGARIDFPVNNVLNDENYDFPGYKGVSILPGLIGVIGPEPTSDGTTDTYTADLYTLTPAS